MTSTDDGGSFVYDRNGNMTSRIEAGVTYVQNWDDENRLVSVTNQTSGQTTTFTYDGDGLLVKKEVDGQATVYIDQHYERDETTGQETKYYFFGGQRVAMQQGGDVYYIHTDHLGSTSIMSDQAGNTVGEAVRYYPYGVARAGSPGALPTDYAFTGQRREEPLGGLYHMGARFYDPALGRWLSADPLVPDLATPHSLNRFGYALNNPLKYRDPNGHFAIVGLRRPTCKKGESGQVET